MKKLMLPAALCLAFLAGCQNDSPEARIHKAFDLALSAAEAGDVPHALKVLAPKFVGPEGVDRDGAGLFLAGPFKTSRMGVTILSQKLVVDGNQAVQSLDVFITTRPGGALMPQEKSRQGLVLRWEQRDGEWLVREVQAD